MKNQEVKVTGARHIRVTMVKDMKELDDVIVTGYYTQAKNAFTGRLPGLRERIYSGVPDEPVTSVGNLDAGIEDCRE